MIFLHGFRKNEQDNISKKEKKALQKLGDQYMEYKGDRMSKLVSEGLIIEVSVRGRVS